jgi:formylglycine-generating enzyme required for sulfatase activity
MPWDWPVEVNNLEARAFCEYLGEKKGLKIRLPTEAELHLIST